MPEIEELIEAAKAKLKTWQRPSNEPKTKHKTWQQMLDRPYGKMENKYEPT